MKKLFIALVLCFVYIAASAQEITGVVTESTTGEPIPYMNIFYDGKGIGTISDVDGNFTLPLHPEWKKLTFSAVGYVKKTVTISSSTRRLKVKIQPDDVQLSEVVVKPKKQKYSRKNNPAVELMKKVIAAKKQSDLAQHDFYQYNKYQKITLSFNNMDSTKMNEGIFKNMPQLKKQLEVCPETQKQILPVSVNETVTQRIYRKDPKSEKDIIKGMNNQGVNELLNTGDILTTVMKDVFTDVNIYDDEIRLLQYPFNSPVSNAGIGFYKYYIMDTLMVDNARCIDVSFVPNNSQDFGFSGHVYIFADSSYQIKKCYLNIPKKSDINFVDNMQILQEFETLPSGERVLVSDDMLVELKVANFMNSFQVRRITKYKDFAFDELPKQLFKRKGREIKEADAMMRDDSFWKEYRQVELSKSEGDMDVFVKSLQQIKGFKYVLFCLKALIENFVETGDKDHPSKIDIGPCNTIITQNSVDGLRLRASGQTTANLNKHWFFKGYGAYGFRDSRWKYMGEVEYSFNKKEYLPREFPKNSIAFHYQYDVVSPNDKFVHTDKDNMFTSFKFTDVNQMLYERYGQLTYEREYENGFKMQVQLRNSNNEACDQLKYRYLPNHGDVNFYYDRKDFTTSEATVFFRFAPGETFINTKQRRVPINLDAPVFTISHTMGFKDVLGGDYKYNFSEVTFYKRLWLTSWGKIDTHIKAGAQWNKVPYPLLITPAANLSYIMEDETFNLINNMEFLNDRYASLQTSWDLNGKIFNRIPLLKKLKWREFIGVNVLWGKLTDKNNPFLAQNQNSDILMDFPAYYNTDGTYRIGEDGNPIYRSYVMDPKRPYVEAIVGIHNIFKLVHVEYVRRLNYLDLPTSTKWGIRFMFRVTF